MSLHPQKVMVIGNVAAGKTRLSRSLALKWHLPLTHIDSVQFGVDLKMKPLGEVRRALKDIEDQPNWLIDGYGPLDMLEKRMQKADLVIFIDLPLWRHQWWLVKRQIQNLWSRREELPEGSSELSWGHTKKMFQVLKSAHRQMRPELLRILARDIYQNKVWIIKTPRQWRRVYKNAEI